MVSEKPRRVPNRCDGHQLHGAFITAAAWLTAHAAEVDALNVYPVPDGDTGSNMSQTMHAALAEAAQGSDTDAGRLAATLAHGALMGARGNSGVILSQLLRGFARALERKRTFSPADLAGALDEASVTAYRAVVKPVEGTILTVAKAAGRHAGEAAQQRPDFVHVLGAAVSAARLAVKETRNQLPVLRQAGVVDAGGQGYLLLLEGGLRHLQGHDQSDTADVVDAVAAGREAAPTHAHVGHRESAFGYCTECVIEGAGLSELDVRSELAALGDSLLVVGDGSVLRVHIHAEDPGRVLSVAARHGRLRQVKVQDMQAQHDVFAHEVLRPPTTSTAVDAADGSSDTSLPVGIAAVASGAGFVSLFRSLGATVVPGGQTINPSTQQILAAIQSCVQDTVVVLPNNDNVVSTARQAASLSRKRVEVLATNTMPQGIAALLAVRFDEGLEQMLDTMRAAADGVRTIEVTTAVRDAEIDSLQVVKGDYLGIVDGRLTVAGTDVASVITDLLETMPLDRCEILTLYAGEDSTAESAQLLLQTLARRYPELAVELHEGGQPHYQFVMSLE